MNSLEEIIERDRAALDRELAAGPLVPADIGRLLISMVAVCCSVAIAAAVGIAARYTDHRWLLVLCVVVAGVAGLVAAETITSRVETARKDRIRWRCNTILEIADYTEGLRADALAVLAVLHPNPYRVARDELELDDIEAHVLRHLPPRAERDLDTISDQLRWARHPLTQALLRDASGPLWDSRDEMVTSTAAALDAAAGIADRHGDVGVAVAEVFLSLPGRDRVRRGVARITADVAGIDGTIATLEALDAVDVYVALADTWDGGRHELTGAVADLCAQPAS